MASNQQVSNLVLQVDASIAVAQRNLQQLARTVQQSSGQMNTALGSTAQAHGRLGLAFNQSRLAQMELQHVVTASVDAYAAGASPLRILTLEMGRVAEAASFMGGGSGMLGKLAGFMSGPWGIAVLLGVNVLAQLIGRFAQGSESIADLVQKMREHAKQAADSKQADLVWSQTLDGLIDRNEKLIDTLQKRLKAEENLDAQTLRQARGDEAKAEQELAAAKTKLANLQAQQAANDNANATGGAGIRAESIAPVAQRNVLSSQIAQARQDVANAQKAVATANAAIVQNTITTGEQEGKALADRTAAVQLWAKDYTEALHQVENANGGKLAGSTSTITEGFEALRKSMDDAASAKVGFKDTADKANDLAHDLAHGKITVAEYATAMKKLATALEAVAEAAKKAKTHTEGEFGKQISFADAADIAKGAGLTVTSAYRSTAHQAELYNDPRYNHAGNPVARPGTSAHEGVNGKWALDIAFAPGLTPEKLKKLYGDQGVSLSAVYKESGHFHIEGSRSQAAAEENAAARAAQKQKTDDDQFAKESDQLDAETLAVRKQLFGGYDSQAKLQSDEIEAQRQANRDAIQKQLDSHQITEGQAEALRLQIDDLSAAKQALVARQQLARGLEQAQQSLDQSYGFQLDDLKFADDMAKTNAEKRKIQLEILDVQYQQRVADLEYQKMQLERNKDFATSIDLQNQANEIQAQINRLPTEKAHDQARVQQGTMNPLQQYFDGIPHTADQVNQALQSIEVEGIQGLVGALGQAGKGWGAMRDAAISALQEIASKLIELGIERMIFSMFGSAVLGSGGSLGASMSTSLGGALSYGGPTLDTLSAGLPHMAGGGTFPVNGRGITDGNMLSVNGIPRAMVDSSETIAVVPRASSIGIPRAANSNTYGGDIIHNHFHVADSGDPLKNRQTGMQHAAGAEAEMARRRKKGIA